MNTRSMSSRMRRKSPFELPHDVLQHILRHLLYRQAIVLLITCKQPQLMPMYKKYFAAKATLIQSYWRRNMALVKRLDYAWKQVKAGGYGGLGMFANPAAHSHFGYVASWCFEEWAGEEDYPLDRESFANLLNGYMGEDDDDLDDIQYSLDLMTPEQRAEREDLKEKLLPLWPENHDHLPPLRKYCILRNIPTWVFEEFYNYY